MFKRLTKRNNNTFKYLIVDHFLDYKWGYIIFLIIILTGLIFGFILGFNRADNFSITDMPDTIFVKFISKKIGVFALFFSRLFGFLGLVLLILSLCFKPFLCWINFFIVLYHSFLVGINSAILISLFKIGGIVNVIFLYLPINVVCLVLIAVVASIGFLSSIRQKQTGYGVFSAQFFMENKMALLICFMLAFFCFLIEAIIMPHITVALLIKV